MNIIKKVKIEIVKQPSIEFKSNYKNDDYNIIVAQKVEDFDDELAQRYLAKKSDKYQFVGDVRN